MCQQMYDFSFTVRGAGGTDGTDEGIQQDMLFLQPHLAAFQMLCDVDVADLVTDGALRNI